MYVNEVIMHEDKKQSQKIDPVKAQAIANADDMGGLSPMGDAEDFQPDQDIQFAYDDLHPFFQELFNEHVELTSYVEKLNQAVTLLGKEHVLSPESGNLIKEFLEFFHMEFVPHNKKEESKFFPLLHERLMATEEHSNSANPFTGIKILEDDHIHALRLGAILSNQVYLMGQFKDFKTQSILCNEIKKTANELAEVIELHIFREDHIALGLGQKLLTKEELDMIHSEFK